MDIPHVTKSSLLRQPHFMRLNLMHTELSSMLSKLHSYLCEPCTSEMYDQYLELNHKGILLKQTIDKVSQTAKNQIKFSKHTLDDIDSIGKKYDTFQKSLTVYLNEAIIHH
ncbi:hypothetical protein [Aquimarina sp. AU474]|uniref:hypothetical protein n=1 Tax=Aquimarina sp. AU474 TaxID=2108529 RepID=UPI00135867B4|nr:hypothetical protein [Aquimarina sp. AU474]